MNIQVKTIAVSEWVSKVGDLSWGWPEGSLFNSYYTDVEDATPFAGLLHFILDPHFKVLSA